jgi:hypothetical protein
MHKLLKEGFYWLLPYKPLQYDWRLKQMEWNVQLSSSDVP